jgi:hypothetical protein
VFSLGAVGCSLLSFILPCLIDLKLRGSEMPYLFIVKDVIIIVLAIIVSVAGIVSIIISLTEGKEPQ